MAAHDIHGAVIVDDLTQRFGGLKLAVEVRLLDIEGGHIVAKHLTQGVGVGSAVLHGHNAHFVTCAVAVGADGIDRVGMGGGGHQRYTALTVTAHGGGLCGGGSAVIDGGVGHIHARQLTDHGLILKDGLQHTLAHFRLIGRIGGEELLLVGNELHNTGDVVVISAGASEHGGEHAVLCRHGGYGAVDLALAHAGGDVRPAVQIHLLRHIPVQITEILQAQSAEHFLPLLGCGGNIASHITPPRFRRRSRNRKRTAALHCRKHFLP